MNRGSFLTFDWRCDVSLTVVLLLSGFFFEARQGFVLLDGRPEPGVNRWHHRVDQMLINDLPGGFPRPKKTVGFLPAWAKMPSKHCESGDTYFAEVEVSERLEQVILDRENLPLRCIHNPIFVTTEQLLSAKDTDCE